MIPDWLMLPNVLTQMVEGFARIFVGFAAYWVFSGR